MGRQIVKIEQIQSLKEVKPLKMGQLSTVDKTKRRRVTKEEFQKVIKAVSSVVGDILQLIWYTGMRPYEACEIRPCDILTDDPNCWLYIPGRDKTPVGDHKTAHFGRVKVIPLTKKSKKILASRIKDFNSKGYIFSPEEAVQELLGRKAASRKTPLKCGNSSGTNKKNHPMVQPGKKYNSNSLCHACKRGCERAGVEVFVPYDLRRTMATGTRSILGKEAARVLLGHTKTDTTDIYLLEEVQEAIKVAKLLDYRK
jgi:integrase